MLAKNLCSLKIFFQGYSHGRVCGQPKLVSLDFRHQSRINEMMAVVLTIRSRELDPIVFHAIHDTDVDPIRPDHLHMLSYGG
jgi:hypothetical protein